MLCIKNDIGTQGEVCTVKGLLTTDRSKAVVPMLFLFCVALYCTLRGASCLVLPCSLSMCFSILLAFCSPCLGKRELVFVLIVYFLLAMHTLIFVTFFSSFWCRGSAAASACGSSWTFLFAILSNYMGV